MCLTAPHCLLSGSCLPSHGHRLELVMVDVQKWTVNVRLPWRFWKTSLLKVSFKSSNPHLCKGNAPKMREKCLTWRFARDQSASLLHQYFILAKSFYFLLARDVESYATAGPDVTKNAQKMSKKATFTNKLDQELQTSWRAPTSEYCPPQVTDRSWDRSQLLTMTENDLALTLHALTTSFLAKSSPLKHISLNGWWKPAAAVAGWLAGGSAIRHGWIRMTSSLKSDYRKSPPNNKHPSLKAPFYFLFYQQPAGILKQR